MSVRKAQLRLPLAAAAAVLALLGTEVYLHVAEGRGHDAVETLDQAVQRPSGGPSAPPTDAPSTDAPSTDGPPAATPSATGPVSPGAVRTEVARTTTARRPGTATAAGATTTTSATTATTAVGASAAARDQLLAAFDGWQGPHEAVPHGVADGVGWKYTGVSSMGVQPYGSALPSYYGGTRYPEWHGVIGWFTVYESVKDASVTTSVEVGGLQLWYLDRGDVWHRLSTTREPTWAGAYAESATGSPVTAKAPTFLAQSVVVTPGDGLMVHGGTSHYTTPWANGRADIKALYFAVRHRLVPTSGAGDLSRSSLLVNAGIDFVPFVGATDKDQGGSGYWPNAGLGRLRLVQPGWRRSDILVTDPSLTKAQLARIAAPALD